VTAALTPEQRQILENRGVLAPGEIQRLASKTRRVMGGERGHKASCHSDAADGAEAHRIQSERLDPVSLEPLDEQPNP
jgi:phosphomethylpyrimidine synthase